MALTPELTRVRRTDRIRSVAASAMVYAVLYVFPPRNDWVETAPEGELLGARVVALLVTLAVSAGFAIGAARIASGLDRPMKSRADGGLSPQAVRVRSAAAALFMSFAFPACAAYFWRPGIGWLVALILLTIGTLVCTSESRWESWALKGAISSSN